MRWYLVLMRTEWQSHGECAGHMAKHMGGDREERGNANHNNKLSPAIREEFGLNPNITHNQAGYAILSNILQMNVPRPQFSLSFKLPEGQRILIRP
ncbi:hypothetical protein AMTR_s00141p00015700 [Amborella trichopoda]|uniref:Uncharacterized protein n=1 Tax=Amborella trichopoda TaxID=13333 RepID=W1PAQ6_AMBTC|nr:hypothetical protein AMTR_s00141p00015700 [Amborella trichopoda]